MNIIIAINSNFEHIFSNDIIVYKNEKIYNVLNIIITKFENVFINIENIINFSKNQ